MLRLLRAVALLVRKRGLGDEHVRSPRRLDDLVGGAGVARDDELASRSRRPQYLLRRDRAAVGERHLLAALQHAALRSARNAERVRPFGVEAARTSCLDQ